MYIIIYVIIYIIIYIYIYYAKNISRHSTVFRSIPLYSHFAGWTTHFQPVSNISTSHITSRINYMMWVKQTKPSIYSENITLNREKHPSKGEKTCRRPNKQNGSKWMVCFWFTHVHTIKIQTKIDAYGWLWMTMDDGWFMDDYGCLWMLMVVHCFTTITLYTGYPHGDAAALDAAATAAAA